MFDSTLNKLTNVDTITDSLTDNDKIALQNKVFTKLTYSTYEGLLTGTLKSEYFCANSEGSAQDSNDYIVYNTTSGALYYDLDGQGSASAVQFATLEHKETLKYSDFLVV